MDMKITSIYSIVVSEKKWRNSLPKYTDQELAKIFPEAKGMIKQKIDEYQKQREQISKCLKEKLLATKQMTNDFSEWFYREWLKVNQGMELLKIDKHLARLSRQLWAFSNERRKVNGRVEQNDIEQAIQIPLLEIANTHLQKLQKRGKNWVALCPFHQEKTPSFTIFEDNYYKCFGCGEYGNTINFVRLLYGYSFQKAIKHLIKNQHE